VALLLRAQLSLERPGLRALLGLDPPGLVLRGELGLELGLVFQGPGLGSTGSAALASLEQAHPGCLSVISCGVDFAGAVAGRGTLPQLIIQPNTIAPDVRSGAAPGSARLCENRRDVGA